MSDQTTRDLSLDGLLSLPDAPVVTRGDTRTTARDLMDKALRSSKGLEVECADDLAARRLQVACHAIRRAERKANIKALGLETSEYDDITVSCRDNVVRLEAGFLVKVKEL